MKATPGELIILPDALMELEIATHQILRNALDYEADLNVTSATTDIKSKLLQSAVHDLDRQAIGVYFGRPVQIEGNYSYPTPEIAGDDVLLRTIHEFGLRRGSSLGFYGKTVEYFDEAGAIDPMLNEVRLFHAASIGNMVIQSNLLGLQGGAKLEAPIRHSTLSLCSVEDFKTQVAAEQRIRGNKRDARWADTIDDALFQPDGPNLKQLGGRLTRLQLLHSDKVPDYLTYINETLKSDGCVTEVICDQLFDYGPGQLAPVLVRSDNVISGYEPMICLADAYRIDHLRQTATKLARLEPVLSLRATLQGRSGDHILHVPLSGIHCSEFK